jgi:NADP-dependent 3-hydroxy acid dehydrogenase YdfG
MNKRQAIVTGASSGIGRAIAARLLAGGLRVKLIGRDRSRLEEVARGAEDRAETHVLDLEDDAALASLAAEIGELDVLVHAAGSATLGSVAAAPIANFDQMMRLNARVPFLLTQLLIPALKARKGQVVFINSGAGKSARANWSQYAMTKFALVALADSLREELKADGVRVISVFPGRTASPMQAAIHREEGKAYDPGRFIQPEDLGTLVFDAIAMPRTANVHEIVVRHPE